MSRIGASRNFYLASEGPRLRSRRYHPSKPRKNEGVIKILIKKVRRKTTMTRRMSILKVVDAQDYDNVSSLHSRGM